MQINPKFAKDVYACSIYGNVAIQNSIWYVDGESAAELARRFKGTPALSLTSDMTGLVSNRWRVVQIPVGSPLLPPAGFSQTDPTKIELIMSLPLYLMWVLQYPGFPAVNAGYLADYYKRNPEDKFPGLADKYVRSVLAQEGISA